MAPQTTSDDDLKLFYAYIQLAPQKTRTTDVANFMGLKEGATGWRYQALMKRCKAKFGDIGAGGVPLNNGSADAADDDNAAAATPATPNDKRRRTTNANGSAKGKNKIKNKPTGATAAGDDDEDDDDGTQQEQPAAKKAKTAAAKKRDALVKVKNEVQNEEGGAVDGAAGKDEG